VNEEGMARFGPQRHRKKKKIKLLYRKGIQKSGCIAPVFSASARDGCNYTARVSQSAGLELSEKVRIAYLRRE